MIAAGAAGCKPRQPWGHQAPDYSAAGSALSAALLMAALTLTAHGAPAKPATGVLPGGWVPGRATHYGAGASLPPCMMTALLSLSLAGARDPQLRHPQLSCLAAADGTAFAEAYRERGLGSFGVVQYGSCGYTNVGSKEGQFSEHWGSELR